MTKMAFLKGWESAVEEYIFKKILIVIAQFDYQPQMVDELKLTKGDLVRLLEDVEDGWARGEVKIYF